MPPLRRSAAAVAVAAVGVLMCAAPAAIAVQTDRFGLAAIGNRTSILLAPGHGAVREHVAVYNRTATKMTILLDVVEALPQPDHTLNFGAPGRGLAGHIDISVHQADLAPHEQRDVTVTVHRPGSIDHNEYAALTAVERASPTSGVGVTQRLAVFIGIVKTGGDNPVATTGTGNDGNAGRIAAVVVAAVLAVGTAMLIALSRRRRERA
jgi:hypothetical protein